MPKIDNALASIHIYPVKSTAGVNLSASEVTPRGLRYDRQWAIINQDKRVLTAREYPKMLGLRVTRFVANADSGLEIQAPGEERISVVYPPGASRVSEVKLFSEQVGGVVADDVVNSRLSDYLGVDCRLIYMDAQSKRPLAASLGGVADDEVSYADECPLLLISQASLDELNARLDNAVPMSRFRPNLVIAGGTAFQEDQWREVTINDCVFEVTQRCERCALTTIDPECFQKDARQEPLRTLSSYRKFDGGAVFGVHLVPRKLGSVSVGDALSVC